MLFAQVYFVYLLLGGFLLVAMASVIYALEPSRSICIGREWLVTMGYSLELLPVIVKLAAFGKMVQSPRKFKRVQISPQTMACRIVALLLIVLFYLIIWTMSDAPEEVETRELVEEGEKLVEARRSCNSESQAWELAALGWHTLLLITATVLAIQSRSAQTKYNESGTLAAMVYSQVFFMIIRVVISVLQDENVLETAVSSTVISFLLSFDVSFGICIYIVPKLFEAQRKPDVYRKSASCTAQSVAGSENDINQDTNNNKRSNNAAISKSRPSLTKRRDNQSGRSQAQSSSAVKQQLNSSRHDSSNHNATSMRDSVSEQSTEDRFGSSMETELEPTFTRGDFKVSATIVEEPSGLQSTEMSVRSVA
jgi:hypothetical protein